MKISRSATAFIATFAAAALTTAYAGTPSICGDVNGNGTVTSGDALLVLKNAVGQPIELLCPSVAQILKTGETTSYGDGSDGALQAGAPRSFTDNGDGTITDNTTGLMWEKKDRSGGVHEQDAFFIWSDSGSAMDGNIVSFFLAALNDGDGFAGHKDWRIPNQNELLSLLDYGTANPAIAPEFNSNCAPGCTVLNCSCTRSDFYWSSTTSEGLATRGWTVSFGDGAAATTYKSISLNARAVRTAF